MEPRLSRSVTVGPAGVMPLFAAALMAFDTLSIDAPPLADTPAFGGNPRNLLRGNAVDSHTTSYPKIRERVWFIFCWMASCVEIDFWINSDRLSLMLFNASRLARIRS